MITLISCAMFHVTKLDDYLLIYYLVTQSRSIFPLSRLGWFTRQEENEEYNTRAGVKRCSVFLKIVDLSNTPLWY